MRASVRGRRGPGSILHQPGRRIGAYPSRRGDDGQQHPPSRARLGAGRRWIVGTYQQDQYLPDGTFVLTWQLHWVAGWDSANSEYRATIAGNYGHAGVMRGSIDGDRLAFETIGDSPVRLRLTWDISDPATMRWWNEMSAGGGPWSLVEEYRCTPLNSQTPPPEGGSGWAR